MDRCLCADHSGVALISHRLIADTLPIVGVYRIECVGANGLVRWIDTAPNTVVNQGKDAMLDVFLAGASAPGNAYMSLITAGTAISTSTYASSGLTEAVGVIAQRQQMTWSGAANGSKSSNAVSFTVISGTNVMITGNLLVLGPSGSETVGDTATSGAVLFSSAQFAGGGKSVSTGDVLNVTYAVAV